MANVFPPIRTESSIPEKMLVELYSVENATMRIPLPSTLAFTASAF